MAFSGSHFRYRTIEYDSRRANAASIAGRTDPYLYSIADAIPGASHVRTTREELVREYRRLGWWSDTRITDLFDAAARSAASQLAVLDPPNRDVLVGGSPLRLTFKDVADLADGYALRLLELGLGRDDILVTQLPNIAEYPALYLAALRLGIIVSPVPMQFRRHELEQIVDLTGARATLTVRALKGADYAADAVELGKGRPLKVLCLGTDAPEGSVPFVPAALTTGIAGRTRRARRGPAGLGRRCRDDLLDVWNGGHAQRRAAHPQPLDRDQLRSFCAAPASAAASGC